MSEKMNDVNNDDDGETNDEDDDGDSYDDLIATYVPANSAQEAKLWNFEFNSLVIDSSDR